MVNGVIRGRFPIGNRLWVAALAMAMWASFPALTHACGGFFCRQVVIDQAGEQIIFRQDGTTVTAIVLIQYQGDADDFSWILPVPGEPDFELASDLVFSPLEQATRPQFSLTYEGAPCDFFFDNDNAVGPPLEEGAPSADPIDDAVEVLEQLTLGPFEIQLVHSDDPAAMAEWLDENGYDLTDRGQELITPYVEEGMNFVALRLAKDQGVGDIQPLKLTYESECPMIPIRLTAVAAVPDMGILVWMVGDARAVPLNYLHLDVNYAKLAWYQGNAFAYADYQDLVTEAMDEAGGQGFVTDYAGTDLDVLSQLPDPDTYRDELVRLGTLGSDTDFYAQLYTNFLFSQDKVVEVLQRQLPLPDGQDEVVYGIPTLLQDVFDAEELTAARAPVINELIESIITPLEATLDVFADMPYVTRLYTTLSPEEMTLDPVFSYNPDLTDQQLLRAATVVQSCISNESHWDLVLGEGTDRVGDVVIRKTGFPPFAGRPDIDQPAVSRAMRLNVSGPGEVVTDNFGDSEIGNGNDNGSTEPESNENESESNDNESDSVISDSLPPPSNSLFGFLCGSGTLMASTMCGLAFLAARSRRRSPGGL
ncbi:MAG: DUF2330 domain-containing protein [Planctomycetes bacterium]|nr:DUF2330 domain-containing protein [Planctomycetota bacterium]